MTTKNIQPSSSGILGWPARSGWLRWQIVAITLLAGLSGFMLAFQLAGRTTPAAPPGQSAAALPALQGNCYCGDGTCEDHGPLDEFCPGYKETCRSCEKDCGTCEEPGPGPGPGPCTFTPNDGTCQSECGEGCWNSGDCVFCGDGCCNPVEVDTCLADCPLEVQCGDGVCSALETCDTCPGDCGTCEPEPCGDGTCSDDETCDTCEVDCGACPPPVVCGDGTCSAGETCGTCAADCGACPVDEPTAEPTEEPTDEPTDEPTEVPTETPTLTPTPEPEEEPQPCALVPYESRPGGWQQSYARSSSPGNFIPANSANAEVYVCPDPPQETICIQLYGDLLELADGDQNLVTVVDCPDGGECRVFEQVASVNGDEMCFNPAQTAGIDCGVGCAFAPLVIERAPFPWWILLLILLLLLLLLLYLFLSRRRRDEEEEPAEY